MPMQVPSQMINMNMNMTPSSLHNVNYSPNPQYISQQHVYQHQNSLSTHTPPTHHFSTLQHPRRVRVLPTHTMRSNDDLLNTTTTDV